MGKLKVRKGRPSTNDKIPGTRFCEYALADSHLAQDVPQSGRREENGWRVACAAPFSPRREILGARPHTHLNPSRLKIPNTICDNQIFPSHPIVEPPGLPISRQRRSKMLYSVFCRCTHRPLTADRQAIRSSLGWEGKIQPAGVPAVHAYPPSPGVPGGTPHGSSNSLQPDIQRPSKSQRPHFPIQIPARTPAETQKI